MTAMHSDRLMLAVLPEFPSLSETLAYQFSGLMVVFAALGAIWGLLELTGALFRRTARKAGALASPAVVTETKTDSTSDVAAAPMPERISPLTSALITATIHAASQGRARILSVEPQDPDVVHAIIAAAVHCMFEGRARVVAVNPIHADSSWAREGRRDIFSSHRVR